MSWILAAALSAFFAGIVSILAKLGVKTTDSDVATALRTVVVLVFAWIAAGLAGHLGTIASLSSTTWAFLVLSGLATGASWICYFKALSLGDVNKVVPIDKSSAVLASLLAIVLFAETAHLGIKLVCIAVILTGTMLMIERKPEPTTGDGTTSAPQSRTWLVYAILSAVFAALTSILGKIGIDGVDSNLGTAIRTTVVLIMAWLIVAWKGKMSLVRTVERREAGFLALSGVATGASWLLYYYAVQAGVVSVVVQIDKLSILVSVLFASLALKEHLTRRALAGLSMITVGTALMCVYS